MATEDNLNSTKEVEPIKIFSLGFRCTSAAILKKLNLKNESYPFDWLVSRLSVIKQCIEDDFKEFVNMQNYEHRHTNTYEMADSNKHFVCDEYLMINKYYQPLELMNAENSYKYYLAMNHHNICEPHGNDYYHRCIERFRCLLFSNEKKIYLHIAPLLPFDKYVNTKTESIDDIIAFDDFLYNYTNKNTKGIVFIMVKDENLREKVGYLFKEIEKTKTKIYLIYTNKDFIDAGEIYMGNHYHEVKYIKEIILQILQEENTITK
jgi:hypothetical protein